MSELKSLITKLGGPSKVSRTCEISRSAVSQWIRRETIPAQHVLSVSKLAKENLINLTPTDLLENFTKSKLISEELPENDKM